MDFKIGDKVKLYRKGKSHTKGFNNTWIDSEMDENIGKIFTIIGIENCGISFKETKGFLYPPDCLELVKDSISELPNQEIQGMKYDDGKLLFGCVTRGFAEPLKEIAKVMTFGAKKYKRDSWQTVPNAGERYEDALDRHLNAWKSGELFDPETSLPHLAHAACNIMFLLYFEIKGKLYGI